MKITLKDLPLHSISNEQVLEALKEICPVQLEVHYSNVWHDGGPITIHNGDHFAYVVLSDIEKLPSSLEVSGVVSQIFKPMAMSKC